MPWRETSPMQERIRSVRDCQSGLHEMTEHCARHRISRQPGYKCRETCEPEGSVGLEDRSRAPHSCPHRISDEVRGILLKARQRINGTDGYGVRPVLERVSREAGVSEAIQTDNGISVNTDLRHPHAPSRNPG